MEIKSSIKIESNMKEVSEELERAVIRGLKAIGEKAVTYASRDCPVDTGRLRASITYALPDGSQSKPGREAEAGDAEMKGLPDDDTLVLGTNVVYAAPQEFNEKFIHKSGKAHFLRDSISTHGREYEDIMSASLKAK